MSDIIISVQDLNLWYGNHQALHHINMGIPEKSITAFIGPSGCGKSTLLKTLNRMNDLVKGVRITGSVCYLGQDIHAPEVEVSELRRQIGAMQDAGMGGFFMHARGGLETEYLSEDWFRAVEASVDEAKKRGMQAWSARCGMPPYGTR